MQLFKPSISQQYGPKTIKLSDLYRHAVGNDLSASAKVGIMKKLVDQGYSDNQVKLFFSKELSANRAKEVAGHLADAKTNGFNRSPSQLVNDYIHKMAIKNKNVARVKHELSLEARQDPLENIIKPVTAKTTRSPLRKLY